MTQQQLALSVLDQSTVAAPQTPPGAIRDTVALAAHCEALGYRRFWVSEHHNHPSLAGTAPEILLAALAMRTQRIRIGSAGVMLPHYSALHVAEQFRVLDALAPGRIDLGLGRAPGSDGRTAFALNPDAAHAAERFPEQLRDLIQWLHGRDLGEGHPFRSVAAHPMDAASAPRVWMLGSSDYGAQVAAHFGLPYAFAHFITDGQGAERAIALYRERFRPSDICAAPEPVVCLWALACDTEAEARHLFRSRARWRLDRNQGRLGPLQAPQDIPPFSGAEEAEAEALWQRSFAGSAAQVAAKLRSFAAANDLAEIAVVTWTHDQQAKRRSYELLARELGLDRLTALPAA